MLPLGSALLRCQSRRRCCYLLSSGCLPDCWRDVAITSIPKGVSLGTGSMCYILIGNTSILLKLTEKLLINKVQPTLSMASDPCQFAYTPGSGTLDPVATLSHQILHSPDKKSYAVRYCFLDFSSAFNTIPRQGVLDCLSSLGLPY